MDFMHLNLLCRDRQGHGRVVACLLADGLLRGSVGVCGGSCPFSAMLTPGMAQSYTLGGISTLSVQAAIMERIVNMMVWLEAVMFPCCSTCCWSPCVPPAVFPELLYKQS